jgi:dolichyl-diphosphooligosaccharide--protein glycosyltransferase
MAASKSKSSPSDYIFSLVWIGAVLYGIAFFLQNAYNIRLQAIEEFGPVIHEFDPYFNWRATQYLYDNGAKKFFTWFDHMVWYPLVSGALSMLLIHYFTLCMVSNLIIFCHVFSQGRPVGTTIYPGMQFTAVFLKNYIIGDKMSLNDICCYMPVWFGVAASFLVGCIAYETSLEGNSMTIFHVVLDALTGRYTEVSGESGEKPTGYYKLSSYLGLRSPAVECAVFAMGFMAVVPAHLMRSVGGGYDNESVAVTAMSLTFFLWTRSLRAGEKYSYLFGILTGVAYFYMVAAWGGYVFVLNLIGTHAAFLVLVGRFSDKVYLAYTLFFVVGTSLAIQVPVVGWTPLKSLEQLGPCAVFLGYQFLQYCEVMRKKNKWTRSEAWKFRIKLGVAALIGIVLVIMAVTPKGYFGPLSSRVRGLFVPHTKTGNPLVDSVAEHQAASQQAYWQYLHILCFLAPLGFVFMMFRFGDASSFLFVYAFAAYFFSHKMVRLILLTAPIASSLSGIAVGRLVSWCLSTFMEEEESKDTTTQTKENENSKAKSIKKKDSKATSKDNFAGIAAIQNGFNEASKSTEGKIVKGIASIVILGSLYYQANTFKTYSWAISKGLSNPSIIIKGQLRDGTQVVVDDYREAYWWLRDNTPEDARIMAW